MNSPEASLIPRLRADAAFRTVDFAKVLDQSNFVGRAAEQVDEWIDEIVTPIRGRYAELLRQSANIDV